MERDLHSQIEVRSALDRTDIGSDTTTVGNVIDMGANGAFDSLEYVIHSGTITDGTYTLVFEESDVVTFGGEETVVPADRILGDTVDLVAADDDVVRRAGVIGKKQFQRLSVVSTGVTTGGDIGAIAILGHARTMPTAEQAT